LWDRGEAHFPLLAVTFDRRHCGCRVRQSLPVIAIEGAEGSADGLLVWLACKPPTYHSQNAMPIRMATGMETLTRQSF
jgi:hypothetical protein